MSDIENPRSWNITINQNVVIFLSDLNADDDTVTSTSQFIREEVIFTPAAGTLSTYAYFWILYGVWMETIAKAQKRVGKINYAVALIHNTPFRYHIFTSLNLSLSRWYSSAQHTFALMQLCTAHRRAIKTSHSTLLHIYSRRQTTRRCAKATPHSSP